MSGPERTQIVRIDCPDCQGRGWIRLTGGETNCERCGASGCLEKEVPFKFETNGRHTTEELAELFAMNPEEVKDEGHNEAKAPQGAPTDE